MGFLQKDYWSCPFCDKSTIEVWIKPSFYKAKTSYGGKGGRKTTWSKSKEEVIILSQKCSNCGKTCGEIEKKWKEEGML